MTGHFLAALSAISRRPRTANPLPEKPLIAHAARTLESRFGDGNGSQPPLPPDLPTLWKRLDAAAQSNDYTALTDRDWRESPWCFWLRAADAELLAQRPSFMRRYAQWLEPRQRKSDYRRLVQAWLLNFNRNNPPHSAATVILDACAKWPEWLWAQRHTAHALFNVEQGPTQLANQVLEEPRPVRDILNDRGLGEWLQTGGYAETAFAALLADLPRRLDANANVVRTLDLVRRSLEWGQNKNGGLQFPKLQSQLAESLLLPWVRETPPKEIERMITDFLLKTLGDPRMERTRWSEVNDSAANVFKRWLTGATLEAFVRVIARVAETGHWKYRQAFWMAYYRAGHVLDAWVALGPTAKSMSRQFTDLQGQSADLIRPPLASHSVLLLRIGNLVVADWSHNGKCRIWRENDPFCPALYQRGYKAGALQKASDFEIAHHGSATGNWQRQIHNHIRDMTSITLPPSSYMP